uniref:NACHT domain-containing protein n=1 Tax=Salarias fasciatus TaxID=181472 RepID=A0A672FEM3_SALFA
MASGTNRMQEESIDSPEDGPRNISSRSDVSHDISIDFKKLDLMIRSMEVQERKHSDVPQVTCVSQQSKGANINFSEGTPNCHDWQQERGGSLNSCESRKPERSEAPSGDFMTENHHVTERPFSEERQFQQPELSLTNTLKLLQENINSFVGNELEAVKKLLDPESVEERREKVEVVEDEKILKSNREAFQKIVMNFLKTMKQENLAYCLERKTSSVSQAKLKRSLKKRSQNVLEGIAEARKTTPLNSIFTEVYMTTAGSGEVSDQHEVRQIQVPFSKAERAEMAIACENFFTEAPGREEPARTVLTKGVAGIGKTFLVQKFTLDWAEDKANQDIHFTFPFKFRELNVLKEKKYSLVELIDDFFSETKEAGLCRFEDSRVVFIFDGLDECAFSLDFHNAEILTDVTAPTSVDVLLTNLIRGKLLPSAHLWITTRPAAASQIPPECVDVVTEVRGFTDSQKEDYFRRRFRDERQFSRIMSHIETSPSLHTMCHIPVFCWITATVLQHVLNRPEGGELPKTPTEMYIHFLVFQTNVKREKYDGESKADPLCSPDSRKLIESLGKLAFEQLQKGNFNFSESDLKEYGIDTKAAECSGVFTLIYNEDRGLYQDRLFCFVHLSVQEFLAALHVHMTFTNSSVNLLEKQPTASHESQPEEDPSAETRLYRRAVDVALQSPNGHLDLFLRFLLGLSLPDNRRHLKGLLVEEESSSRTSQATIQYIKQKMNENPSPEKCINLFHCLNELNDRSLEQDIQWYLRSGRFSTSRPSPAHWSALVFILLSSGKDLDVFDLKKYSASEEAFLRLLPVVKASSKALLGGCNLSERSCEALSSLLSSPSCCLRGLDLGNNDLRDSGVQLLSVGLQSPHCKLETLRLSGCLMTDAGCASLTSALTSNPSHLKELDLSYNHLGGEAVERLSALQEDPRSGLVTLGLYPTGPKWMIPGLKKHACKITLDPNTAHKHLYMYDNDTKIITTNASRSCPDHPDRYNSWPQVRSGHGLTGCCYWEVEWEGEAHIAVTYRPQSDTDNSCFGMNKHSWSLSCFANVYYAWHDKHEVIINPPPTSSSSNRVGAYLNWHAGTLSFYSVSADPPVHLHTFRDRFTDSVYPGFGFWNGPGAIVSLCEL